MALSLKISSLLFLLALLSSHHIHARESQFFNKNPSKTNNLDTLKEAQIIPQNQQDPLNKPNQEPNFIPQNTDDGFGHESGQLPPSTTTSTTTTTTNLPYDNEPNQFLPKDLSKNYNNEVYANELEYTTSTTNTNLPYNNEPNAKYLPNNYNTKSYVTEPEGYHLVQENNYNYNNDVNRYQKEAYPATSTTTTSRDNYYAGGNNFNGQEQGVNEFKLGQKSYGTNALGRQGMSDTRYLENGKYYYDLNLDKNNGYPFKNTGRFGDQNVNSYDLNKYSDDGFDNQGEQFQDFQDEQQDLP